MSAKCMAWAFENSPYKATSRCIHLALADVSNDQNDNKLWISQENIAQKANTTRQNVNALLIKMVEEGYLEIVEHATGRTNSNIYRFLMPDTPGPIQTQADRKRVKDGDTLESVKDTHDSDDESVKDAGESVNDTPESVMIADTNSSNSTEPKDKTKNSIVKRNNFEKKLFTDKFIEAWEVYPRKTAKKDVASKWNARLDEGVDEDDLLRAAKNYAAHCKRTRKEKQYTLLPGTFYGPNLRYEEYLDAKSFKKPGQTMETREDGGTFDPKALYRKHRDE